MKRIAVDRPGGPEQLALVDVPVPAPGDADALVKIAYSGVNFLDVYFSTGLYKADLPVTLGSEASGIVESVGHGVTDSRPAIASLTRWCAGPTPSTPSFPAAQLVKIPDGVDLSTGGGDHAPGYDGALPDALDVSARRRRRPASCTPRPAAPAGSSSRWRSIAARACSARSRPRRRRGRSASSAPTRRSSTRPQDFEAEVKRLTDGRGVDVVYDSVGKTTFDKSLASLRAARHDGAVRSVERPGPAGRSGDPQQRGSLFLTRPNLAHHLLTRDELLWRAGDVLELRRAAGVVKVRISEIYPLADAAAAHRDLGEPKTTGKLLLKVWSQG